MARGGQAARPIATSPTPAGRSTAGTRQSARSWYLLASACFRFGQALLRRRRPAQARALPAHAGRVPPQRRALRPSDGARRAALARRTPHGLVAAQPAAHAPPVRRPAVRNRRLARGVRGRLALPARTRSDRAARRRSRAGRDPPLRRALPRRARHRGDQRVRRCRAGRSRLRRPRRVVGQQRRRLARGAGRARDPRIAAVCINGGTDRPTEILDRYPRFVARDAADDRSRRPGPGTRGRRSADARPGAPPSDCDARCTSSMAPPTRSSASRAPAASTKARRAPTRP